MEQGGIIQELQARFPEAEIKPQQTSDGIPTLWLPQVHLKAMLSYLKNEAPQPYRTLFDLTAVDERERLTRPSDYPACDFSAVYHLLSYYRNSDVRLKAPLQGDYPTIPTVTDIWPSANFYEREVWDMFGIRFAGHPNLKRILMYEEFQGHPLRKDYPIRKRQPLIGPKN